MASILLLSGGASRRMGQDKAKLPLGNQDLLSFQVQRLERAGFHVVHGIEDVYKGFKGPLAGIQAALYQHPDILEWVVVPVDMPRLSVSAIESLIHAGESLQSHVAFRDCPLPIFIRVNARSLSLLNEWLEDENGKRSVFAFIEATSGAWINDHSFQNELTNINTPEQWHAYTQEAV